MIINIEVKDKIKQKVNIEIGCATTTKQSEANKVPSPFDSRSRVSLGRHLADVLHKIRRTTAWNTVPQFAWRGH
ncbi:hypothetical protein KIN20_003293 [Parelaphostrongylus tenuis]|uniref:Uncharacterized protein n=1 Tax=Parelaphostrongylus tenuis TaxID=148309 RepID=A0AAD5MPR0_PARTN|nr:hypothetical protein KIN20_003293 [Parelaphostrongylus tenuis]